jgi:hypothetical protein
VKWWRTSPDEKVRVIDVRGNVLEPMTLVEAQAMAARTKAELVHLATDLGMRIFRLVGRTGNSGRKDE